MQSKLQSQKSSLQDYVDKIAAMEKEAEKISELFTSTKDELEVTTQNLQKTRQQRDEKTHLLGHHVERGSQLFNQANELLDTVEGSVSDVEGLHSKLDRTAQVHSHNENTCDRFKNEMHNTVLKMSEDLQNCNKRQQDFYTSMTAKLGELICFFSSICQNDEINNNILSQAVQFLTSNIIF